MKLRINDSDRNVLLSVGTGRFWVTTNEDTYSVAEENYTWKLDFTDTVLDNSYVEDLFPDSSPCNYVPGPQKWKVEFEYPSAGYYLTNSSLFNINITVDPLQVAIELPPTNQSRRRAIDTIPIRGNVTTTDCSSQLVANATVNFEVEGKNYQCTPVYNESTDGWYNCTIPASDPVTLGWAYGYYNVTMNASKLHYNSSTLTSKKDAFRLVSNPMIWDINVTSTALGSVNPEDNWGWGEMWDFKMDVQDPDKGVFDYEALNITIYINTSTGWRQLNSTIRTDVDVEREIHLTYHDFNCSDQGDRNFLFNTTDIFGYVNSSNMTRTIQKDTVYVERIEPSSGTYEIDREGSTTGYFQIRVTDTDNNTYIPAGYNNSFWFTQDNTLDTFDSGWDNTSYAGGYAEYNLNPNCSYEAGQQYWKAGVYEDSCYENQNFTAVGTGEPVYYQFIVIGQLKHYIMTPNWSAGQPIYNVTEQIEIKYNITSECLNIGGENPITSAATNVTLGAPNSIWEGHNNPSESSGIYNYTWNSTGKIEGNWSIMLNSSRTNFNFNSTIYPDWFWLENIEPQTEPDRPRGNSNL